MIELIQPFLAPAVMISAQAALGIPLLLNHDQVGHGCEFAVTFHFSHKLELCS
jgi:hypothetical protein